MTKPCSKCGTTRDPDNYYRLSDGSPSNSFCRQCSKQYAVDWSMNNKDRRLLTRARERAKLAGVPFNITLADIPIPTHCPVLGVRLQRAVGKTCNSTPTVDRIIPEFGYVKGNVKVISHRANRLKQDATPEELRTIADWIEATLQPLSDIAPMKDRRKAATAPMADFDKQMGNVEDADV